MDGIRDETSLRFLHPITNRDKNVRRHAFDAICQTIETWMTGYCTPFNSLESITANGIGGNIAIAKLQERLPDLLRLVWACPYKDVRDKTAKILDDLKVRIIYDHTRSITRSKLTNKVHIRYFKL